MSSAWQASHTQGAIRVVHLLAPVDSGGGEALLADLLRQPSPGLDAAVATLGTAPGLADELNKNGIECFSLGQRLVGQIRGGKIRETIVGAVHVHQWVSLISRLRPHVVHAHGYPASFLVAAAKCDVRKVYTHHYERHPPRSLERQALTQTYNRYDLLTSPRSTSVLRSHRCSPDWSGRSSMFAAEYLTSSSKDALTSRGVTNFPLTLLLESASGE